MGAEMEIAAVVLVQLAEPKVSAAIEPLAFFPW